MADLDERIKLIEEFKATLQAWQKSRDPNLREWLNQNVHRVRNETIEANTHVILTIFPPPAIAGSAPMMRVDPFNSMFDNVYLMSVVPHVADMLDCRRPAQSTAPAGRSQVRPSGRIGSAKWIRVRRDANGP